MRHSEARGVELSANARRNPPHEASSLVASDHAAVKYPRRPVHKVRSVLYFDGLASAISQVENPTMVSILCEERSGLARIVTEELGRGIKCCEVALSSASARTWGNKIRNARKAHDTAMRFVHRARLSEQEANRINQRINHLKTLLEELN